MTWNKRDRKVASLMRATSQAAKTKIQVNSQVSNREANRLVNLLDNSRKARAHPRKGNNPARDKGRKHS